MLLPDPVLRNLQEVETQLQKVTTDIAYNHCGPNSLVRSILFALIGFTGDVIIEKEIILESSKTQLVLHLNPQISFISHSERQAINQVLLLGTAYKQIETFIKEHEHALRTHGLYIRALSISLRSILSQYQQAICNLETEMKTRKTKGKDPMGNVALISTRLHKYATLFPEICRLIGQIEWQNLTGTKLLQLVWSTHLNGIPFIQKAFSYVLQKLHEVFYDQVTAFCVHGYLTDRFQEFILEKNTRSDSDWSHLYQLRYGHIPNKYIPVRVCEKIKFVGQAVQILKQSGEKHLTEEERLRFTRKVTILKRETKFELNYFEAWLDDIKTLVAKRLMNLMKKHDLKAHLETLKDFYCLHNGSFWQVFFEESSLLVQSVPGPTADRDIRMGPWKTTLKKMGLEDHDSVQDIQIGFDAPSFHALKKRTRDLETLRHFGTAKIDIKKNNNPTIVFKAHAKHKCGALCSGYKMPITRGFETKLRFRFPDKSRTGFAFVMQNDRKDWIWAEHDLCGCTAILWSLAITFQPMEDENKLLFEIVKTANNQTPHTLASDRVPINIFNGAEQTIEIKSKLRNKDWRLEVWINGELIRNERLQISKHVKCERATGRAWIAWSTGQASEYNMHVSEWSFSSTDEENYLWDLWEHLSVNYEPKTPLNIVIKDENLDFYNSFFRWMFLLKKGYHNLLRARVLVSSRAANHEPSQLVPIFNTFHHMLFVLSNIIYYIQGNVVTVQYVKLQETLDSDDIEDVIAAHKAYLNEICKRSFLVGNRLILSQLRSMLRLIADFCKQVQFIYNSDTHRRKCIRIKEDFDASCRTLLSRLQVLVAQEPYLSHLILQLDFNNYFSENVIAYSVSRYSKFQSTV